MISTQKYLIHVNFIAPSSTVLLPKLEVISKNFFNGQSEIPLILKEITSTKISAKLLNVNARNYYRYYLCLYFYRINMLLL